MKRSNVNETRQFRCRKILHIWFLPITLQLEIKHPNVSPIGSTSRDHEETLEDMETIAELGKKLIGVYSMNSLGLTVVTFTKLD